ncbi:MAG: PAS domain S-box protein [Bacteroidales bacterium]|nr:PAS domain S-box protein [Bacteroidales bacterium]
MKYRLLLIIFFALLPSLFLKAENSVLDSISRSFMRMPFDSLRSSTDKILSGAFVQGNNRNLSFKLLENNALQLIENAQDSIEIANIYYVLADNYLKRKQYPMALLNFQKSLNIAISSNNIFLILDNHKGIAKVYEASEDYKNAYKHLNISDRIQDSLVLTKVIKELSELDNKSKSFRKLRESKLKGELDYYKETVFRRNTFLMYLAVGCVFLLVLVGSGAIYLYKKEEESNNLLIDSELSAELDERDERYTLLVQQFPQILFELSKTGFFTYINPAGKRITGFDDYYLLTAHLNQLVFPISLEKKLKIENYDDIIALNAKEFKLKKKDGSFLPIMLYIHEVKYLGKFYGFRGFMFDINDRKELEKQILKAVIATEEKESKRFAKDLHDTLGPILSAVKLYANELDNNNVSEKERTFIIDNINSLVSEAVNQTKTISYSLMPSLLKDYGLVKALQTFIEKLIQIKKIDIIFKHKDIPDNLSSFFENNIYKIILELLNNTIKHAEAVSIIVDLTVTNDNTFTLKYFDDGKGFDTQNEAFLDPDGKCLGLASISSRAKSINATTSIKTYPNEGFSFTLVATIS